MITEPDYERHVLCDLVPADYNPREISESELGGLDATVTKYGLVQPIVWNRRTGNIVGGHQRLKVLLRHDVEEAIIAVVDLSLEHEKALNIALNNPATQGQFTDGLQSLLREVQNDDAELFTDLHLDKLLDDMPNDTDWADALGMDKADPEVRQRTFTLSHEQLEVVERAIKTIRDNGDVAEDPENANANGCAIASVCAKYLEWDEQNR